MAFDHTRENDVDHIIHKDSRTQFTAFVRNLEEENKKFTRNWKITETSNG